MTDDPSDICDCITCQPEPPDKPTEPKGGTPVKIRLVSGNAEVMIEADWPVTELVELAGRALDHARRGPSNTPRGFTSG